MLQLKRLPALPFAIQVLVRASLPEGASVSRIVLDRLIDPTHLDPTKRLVSLALISDSIVERSPFKILALVKPVLYRTFDSQSDVREMSMSLMDDLRNAFETKIAEPRVEETVSVDLFDRAISEALTKLATEYPMLTAEEQGIYSVDLMAEVMKRVRPLLPPNSAPAAQSSAPG